jgi:hypothetical protein
LHFTMRNAQVEVREGHDVSVLASPSRAVGRVVNRSTGYWYAPSVRHVDATGRALRYGGSVFAAWFMALPGFSALFAIGSMLEAFLPSKRWVFSHSLRLVALGFSWLGVPDVCRSDGRQRCLRAHRTVGRWCP